MTSTGYHSLLFKGGCRMFWPAGGIKSLGKKENILVDGARRPVSSIWETPNPCVVSAQGFGPHSGCFNWILLHAGSRWLIYSGNDLLGAVHILSWSNNCFQSMAAKDQVFSADLVLTICNVALLKWTDNMSSFMNLIASCPKSASLNSANCF